MQVSARVECALVQRPLCGERSASGGARRAATSNGWLQTSRGRTPACAAQSFLPILAEPAYGGYGPRTVAKLAPDQKARSTAQFERASRTSRAAALAALRQPRSRANLASHDSLITGVQPHPLAKNVLSFAPGRPLPDIGTDRYLVFISCSSMKQNGSTLEELCIAIAFFHQPMAVLQEPDELLLRVQPAPLDRPSSEGTHPCKEARTRAGRTCRFNCAHSSRPRHKRVREVS